MKWYHGSRKEFDSFKIKKGTFLDSNYENPIFLSSDYNFAKNYYYSNIVYTVEVLTDKIFDFRKLPTDLELYIYETKGKMKNELDDYDLGLKLRNDMEDIPELNDTDISGEYNYIVGGDYSNIEHVWFYEWLKQNNFDGGYVMETRVLNLFIFDPKHLKIVDKNSKNEKKEIIYRNMKHIKTFENFQKFITGHDSAGDKEKAISKIENDINSAIIKMKEKPKEFAKIDTDELRSKLLQKAKENNWKGDIKIIPAPNNNLNYIIYVDGLTDLQDVGSSLATGTRLLGNF